MPAEQAQNQSQQTPAQEEKFSPEKEFGNGRYSNVMCELYADSIRLLGLSHKRALKLAHSFGCELGRRNASSTIKFGNRTKDGRMTLRETATMKGVTVTYSISMAKLCVMLQDCKTYGMLEATIELRSDFIEWLDKSSE